MVLAVSALTIAVALGACGGSGRQTYDATAENNGVYVKLGAIDYQLQVSRELNPFATEDHEYLVGLPAGVKGPTPNQIWYGVFLFAINDTEHEAPLANNFAIIDTQGTTYRPVALDPSVNEFVWTGGTLAPHSTAPAPSTTAFFGPTQGRLLLFKLNNAVYNNRPLTLSIRAPGQSHTATISLDL